MSLNRLRSATEIAQELRSGNRIALGRAITLVESNSSKDLSLSSELIESILPNSGNSIRIGITGAPGVGKSTFIESFGMQLIELGKKVAVLSIDPSSSVSSGSILGDKTRMNNLSRNAKAFIRPSAAGDSLGGVNSKTRETIYLCEAAGFDVIIVETVGVGQSETNVKGMVDFFLMLAIAGAGDELQGIKRGIMEMADAVAVNKADGSNLPKSKLAAKSFGQALHLFPPTANQWSPQVKTCSALENEGIDDLWEMILQYEALTKKNGFFELNRSWQNVEWFRSVIKGYMEVLFFQDENRKTLMYDLEKEILAGKLSVRSALDQIQKM